jgi:type III secretion protein T
VEFESLGQAGVSIGVVLARIGAAFLVLPYFTTETIPALVRNVFFVSVALAVVPYAMVEPLPATLSGAALIPILLKEIFVGVTIGFSFGIVFWALQSAGELIDTKVGTGVAQLVDPLTGAQTTLIGAYLGRLGGYVFAALGGLQMFVKLLLSSFLIWPVNAPMPDLEAAGAVFFVGRFDELMQLALLLAAPVLCVLTLLEVGLGFVNRYASQLNVFVLSMALKSWLAILILLLTVASAVSFVIGWMDDQRGLLSELPL